MRAVASWLMVLSLSVAAVFSLTSCGGVSIAPVGGGSGGGGGSPQTTQLAISDSSNNRILIYKTPLVMNESASVVLGQTDFVHGMPNQGGGAAANMLSSPTGMAKDAAGNLYVADFSNCRVLQFRPPFTNDPNASLVIGQPQFTYINPISCDANATAPATGMDTPNSVVVDREGDLWVTDPNFGRVTEYVPPFSNGMAATVAIGQVSLQNSDACNHTNLTNGLPPLPTAMTLCEPFGAAFDAQGNLWIADTGNSRVLEYTPPFSTGMAASLELGQPAATAFTSTGPSPGASSAASLATPNAVAFDASGNLWVADTGNNRVLEFVPPFTNGMAASMVVGQADFSHDQANQGGSSPAADTLSSPLGLNFDSKGNLIVEDHENNRVVIFSPPFSNDMNATEAIGQTALTNGAQNQGGGSTPGASTLWFPSGGVAF